MGADTELELIADYACKTGENPVWHAAEQRLYWIDIDNGRLFRYDPAAGSHELAYQADAMIGGLTIQADGAVLLFMQRGAIHAWREGRVTVLRQEVAAASGSRFNDVQVDPEGRVFATVMPTKPGGHDGKLLRIDPDLTVTPVITGTGTPNGMGFTQDLAGMYFTDSTARTIYRFDYDRATGDLSRRRVFAGIDREAEPEPDGLTTDHQGGVWSAHWNGSVLVRYRPDGTLDRRIPFPTKKVSCPAFGGRELSDLYVTTAGGDDKAANGATAGSLFRLRTDVHGIPDYTSRLGL